MPEIKAFAYRCKVLFLWHIFYMIMLTELLAANLLLFMEHDCPVIHDFIIGSPYVVLIHICPEGQKKGITIVYTIEFSLLISGRMFDEGGVIIHLGTGHFVHIIIVCIVAVFLKIGSRAAWEKGIVHAAYAVEHRAGIENRVGV